MKRTVALIALAALSSVIPLGATAGTATAAPAALSGCPSSGTPGNVVVVTVGVTSTLREQPNYYAAADRGMAWQGHTYCGLCWQYDTNGSGGQWAWIEGDRSEWGYIPFDNLSSWTGTLYRCG